MFCSKSLTVMFHGKIIDELKYCMVTVYNGCTSEKGFNYGYLGFKRYCTIVSGRVFNEIVKHFVGLNSTNGDF